MFYLTRLCFQHVPGYLQNYDKFKAKGINEIYVVSVNDVFVMKYVASFIEVFHLIHLLF